MKVIYKYNFPFNGRFTLEIPQGAEFLHVDIDANKRPSLWALVDTDKPDKLYKFLFVVTGQEIDADNEELSYLASLVVLEGSFVGHLFERV